MLPLLPSIWDAAAGEVLIRPYILETVKGIVAAAGSDSASLWSFVLPVVSHCVDLKHPESLTLAEEGLALWLEVLHNAPEYSADLSAMYPFAPALVRCDLEHVRPVLSVVESYTLLGGRAFLATFATSLPELFGNIFGKAHVNDSVLAVRCVHTALKISGDDAHAVASVLEPVFRYMVSTCIKCDEEIRRTLDIPSFADRAEYVKANPPTEQPAVVVAYFAVLARLFVQATPIAMTFLAKWETEAAPGTGPRNGIAFLTYLVNNWITRFDEISSQRSSDGPWNRRLCCMALLSLLPALSAPGVPADGQALLRERLFEILNCAVDVLAQLKADGYVSLVTAVGFASIPPCLGRLF